MSKTIQEYPNIEGFTPTDTDISAQLKILKKQYGGGAVRAVKKIEKIAKSVVDKETYYAQMSSDQLQAQTGVLKERIANGETLDDILPDAYAVCREASWRVLHQKHFYVQIIGGIALHQGRICQMATGEGKTLTETLPAYLNALVGKVHIVTVNEYLAQRDKDWMGKIFRFLGLTVGITLSRKERLNSRKVNIEEELNKARDEKKQAYECDITYGTCSEFGFDYLRDNSADKREDCVQKSLDFVLIDEVDSILIDEARTPLILSGPSGKSSEMYIKANRFAATLRNSANVDEEGKSINEGDEPNGDYVVDWKQKAVRLTDAGVEKAQKFFGIDNLGGSNGNDNIDEATAEYNYYINNALKARAVMRRNDDYIVDKGEVIIVDPSTGRRMEGRRYNGGLHQAIEAKEGVAVQSESKTYATITLQNYFRLYRKMSGMTGTAKTEEQEFNTIYNIDVLVVPTNKPTIRKDYGDVLFATREAKLKAIVREIENRHKTGQPILVGTTSVDKNRELSRILLQKNIACKTLDAAQQADNDKLEAEADIIAQAGKLGAVTIATSMAGRGTDIVLGGNYEFSAKSDLRVKGFSNDEVAAVIEMLDLGKTDFTDRQRDIANLYKEKCSQYKAEYDEKKQRVLDVGGLCVIGTERYDSRRVDDQLRGRAGRQGDPGCSAYFVSAEDEMVRIFGGDRLKQMMTVLGAGDEPIDAKLVSKSIEMAQKRLEGMHFASRKNVLQYDDVDNRQRKAIYAERNRIMDSGDIHEYILTMADEYARNRLEVACNGNVDVSSWDIDGVVTVDDMTEVIRGFINRVVNAKIDLGELTALDIIADPLVKLKPILFDNKAVYELLSEKYADDLNSNGHTYEQVFNAWCLGLIGQIFGLTADYYNRRIRGNVLSQLNESFGFAALADESNLVDSDTLKASLIGKMQKFVGKFDGREQQKILSSLFIRNALNSIFGKQAVVEVKFDINKSLKEFFNCGLLSDVTVDHGDLPTSADKVFAYQYQFVLESKLAELIDGGNEIFSREFIEEYVENALDKVSSQGIGITRNNAILVNEVLKMHLGFVGVIAPSDIVSARQTCDYLAALCKDRLNAKYNEVNENDEPFTEKERKVCLRYIDSLWIQHVEALEELRQGIGLRAIGQHDPLSVYKKEAFDMFDKLNSLIAVNVVGRLLFPVRLQIRRYKEKDKDNKDKQKQGGNGTEQNKQAQESVQKETDAASLANNRRIAANRRKQLNSLKNRVGNMRSTLDKLESFYLPKDNTATLDELYKVRHQFERDGNVGSEYKATQKSIKEIESKLAAYNSRNLTVSELENRLDELFNAEDEVLAELSKQEFDELAAKVVNAEKSVDVLRSNSKRRK